MSTLYLIALGAVALTILGVVIDAVLSASRQRNWPSRTRVLMVVPFVERRGQSLPFVGLDRRLDTGQPSTEMDRLSA